MLLWTGMGIKDVDMFAVPGRNASVEGYPIYF